MVLKQTNKKIQMQILMLTYFIVMILTSFSLFFWYKIKDWSIQVGGLS